MIAMTTIKTFDEDHKNETNFPSANTNCKMIVNWLFLAMNKKLVTMPAIPSIDVTIMAASDKLHVEFILTTPITTTNPNTKTAEALTQLALNVGEQTTVL